MANENVTKINVSALSKGMYFVKTESWKSQKFNK